MFDMALRGSTTLDITKTLNAEGIPSPFGRRWLKATIYRMLANEVYTGTLVWGSNAKEPPLSAWRTPSPPSARRRSSAA